MKIGVLAAEESWHFQDLKRAASTLEGSAVQSLSFESLSGTIETDGTPSNRMLSGRLDLTSLDRLIVRTMPGGSLQKIVFRMDLLNRLEAAGLAVINPPRAMEISVDKYLSLAILAEHGMPVPATRVAQSLDAAVVDFGELGGDVVYKPIFGSMGNGIVRLNDRSAAEKFFEQEIAAGQVIYQQRFIEHGDSDLRLLVIGDEVVAMKRTRRGHWLTNIAQGAFGERFEPNQRQIDMAMTACRAVGCRIAGVDLLVESATGESMVVDVNAAPGWKALSATTGIDIGRRVLKAVIGAE